MFIGSLSISQGDLVKELKSDSTLQEFFQAALPLTEMINQSHEYFVQNEVLKKFHVARHLLLGDSIYQVVGPLKKYNLIFSHDKSRHMRVRKAYDCNLAECSAKF